MALAQRGVAEGGYRGRQSLSILLLLVLPSAIASVLSSARRMAGHLILLHRSAFHHNVGGVAGIATAGVAISSVIYDLIASTHSAPSEMVEIAQAIHDP